MATLYAATDGTLIRFLTTDQERQFPTAPAGTASTLTFDESTNGTLVTRLNSDWQGCALRGSALTYRGQTVTVAAPSAAYTQRQQVIAQAQQIIDDATAYLALSNPTAAQTTAAVRELVQVVRYLIRQLVLA
jgi:hypothetical protein